MSAREFCSYCKNVYEIESRAKDARNNRRQHAGSQPRLQNGEDKRKHFIARF